jgi:phosphohistidine phosphatase SixA
MRAAVLSTVLSGAITLGAIGYYGGAMHGSIAQWERAPVILIRHAEATVGRDKVGAVKFDDCSTQRNLSDKGRDQARHLGRIFHDSGVLVGKIIASPLCRAYETGRILNLGVIETAPGFIDLTSHKNIASRLIEKEREIIARWSGPGALVIVTHSSNIKALTDQDLEPADMVFLKPKDDLQLPFPLADLARLAAKPEARYAELERHTIGFNDAAAGLSKGLSGLGSRRAGQP